MGETEKYRLLIVEDEPILRQGLERLGAWKENGILLVGSASNGREALELSQELHANLILTDICMPVMDGVELIRRVKEKSPQTQIVVLSNYSDFLYVKQAMKYGAADYLLKAEIDFVSLMQILDNLKEKMGRNEEPDDRGGRLDESVEQRIFLDRLLHGGGVGQAEFRAEAGRFGWKIKSHFLFVIIADIEGEELGREEVERICGRMNDIWGGGAIAYAENGFRINILSGWEKGRTEVLAGIAGQELAKADTSFRMAAGKKVDCAEQIQESYKDAEYLLEYCFYLDGGCFSEEWQKIAREPWKVDGAKLKNAFLLGDAERILGIAEELLERAAAPAYMDPYELLKSAEGILYILLVMGGHREKGESRRIKYFRMLEACRSYGRFCESFRGILREILELDKAEARRRNPLFEEVFAYVNSHLAEDISLRELSVRFRINYSYLSQTFKNEIQMNFSSYLNQQRVNKAIEYLREGKWNVSQVGEMVGYHEFSYFCKVFKKHTGKTPSEYAIPDGQTIRTDKPKKV